MGTSTGTIALESISLEQADAFYEWLQGKSCPPGIEFQTKPQLTEEEAFSVIYYLQEKLGVLPDKFERCRECGCLYDSDSEGVNIDGDSIVVEDGQEKDTNFPEEMYGNYCDSCRPD